MEKQPEEIRREIEQTQGAIEDTVAALVYKTDFKARTKDAVNEKFDAVKGAVSNALGTTRVRLTDAASTAKDQLSKTQGGTTMVVDQARSVVNSSTANAQGAMTVVQANPLGLALGSLAIGFIIGSLLPATTIEQEQLGDFTDQLADNAQARASDFVEQGKNVLNQTVAQVMNGDQTANTSNGADEQFSKDASSSTMRKSFDDAGSSQIASTSAATL